MNAVLENLNLIRSVKTEADGDEDKPKSPNATNLGHQDEDIQNQQPEATTHVPLDSGQALATKPSHD